jgi:hypothetical protein
MQVVYKYTLNREAVQTVFMPREANILTAQVQLGVGGFRNICLWAIRPEGGLDVARTIVILGTGAPTEYEPRELAYINTVQVEGFIFHVFEVVQVTQPSKD